MAILSWVEGHLSLELAAGGLVSQLSFIGVLRVVLLCVRRTTTTSLAVVEQCISILMLVGSVRGTEMRTFWFIEGTVKPAASPDAGPEFATDASGFGTAAGLFLPRAGGEGNLLWNHGLKPPTIHFAGVGGTVLVMSALSRLPQG
jgi:hypothetical protein